MSSIFLLGNRKMCHVGVPVLEEGEGISKRDCGRQGWQGSIPAFLEQASQGVDETALFVKGTSKEAAMNK